MSIDMTKEYGTKVYSKHFSLDLSSYNLISNKYYKI